MSKEKAKAFKVKIDNESFYVEDEEITGAELLELANKSGSKFSLYLKDKGKSNPVGPNDIVDLSDPGVEKFITIAKDLTEGEQDSALSSEKGAKREEFQLPTIDKEYLESQGYVWETIIENNVSRLVIRNFKVPKGYNQKEVEINLRIPTCYPDQQIDMAYIYPYLELESKQGIKGIASDNFESKRWQRWSRHRTKENPWRAGIDGVETHLLTVEEWLKREVSK